MDEMRINITATDTFIENDIWHDGVKIGEVELCPGRQEISRLVIFEPYQNKGYGTEIVRKLVKEGYKSLWVRSDNKKAIHVYEKNGFKMTEAKMYEMRFDKDEI